MWEENKHPRDEDGKFTNSNGYGFSNNGDKLLKAVTEYKNNTFRKGKSIENNGMFVKIGETSVTQPEKQNGVFNGSDKYPQTTSTYKFIKKADNGIVEINLNTDIQKQFDKATRKERQKLAYKYIMDNLRGKYPTSDGREVFVQKVGADKMTNNAKEIKIRILPELASLIKNGNFYRTIKVEHKIFTDFAYCKVDFKIRNRTFEALLNIGIRSNGESTLYEINKFLEK